MTRRNHPAYPTESSRNGVWISYPFDLEQREGRVHRYKGHAVRKNVARRWGLSTLRQRLDGQEDPWGVLFGVAAEHRAEGVDDLVPYWIYDVPGGAKIERRVPMFPFSRETGQLVRLQRELALYRLVFGQPRQEDLLKFLTAEAAERLREARIDLEPPRLVDEDWEACADVGAGIRSAFQIYFAHWGLRLPPRVQAGVRGTLKEAGWQVKFLAGEDDGGLYLDCYARHRMTNDRHFRIRPSGQLEDLPALRDMILYPAESKEEEQEEIARQHREWNENVWEMLSRKGFA